MAANEPGPSKNNEEKENHEEMYNCYICLDIATNSVVTQCGHLFCWPCLHTWLEKRMVCPVCKAAICKEKLIRVYGQGNAKQEDPSNIVPPRPLGQRSGPENNGEVLGLGFGIRDLMAFGIGAVCSLSVVAGYQLMKKRAGKESEGKRSQKENGDIAGDVDVANRQSNK